MSCLLDKVEIFIRYPSENLEETDGYTVFEFRREVWSGHLTIQMQIEKRQGQRVELWSPLLLGEKEEYKKGSEKSYQWNRKKLKRVVSLMLYENVEQVRERNRQCQTSRGQGQTSLYSPLITLAVLGARPQTQAPHVSKLFESYKSNPKTVT